MASLNGRVKLPTNLATYCARWRETRRMVAKWTSITTIAAPHRVTNRTRGTATVAAPLTITTATGIPTTVTHIPRCGPRCLRGPWSLRSPWLPRR
jgi:hypothetical protein